MADLKEIFRTLKDDSTGDGEAMISRTEGEVAAAKAGAIGFSFKDSSGNVVLPALNVAGQIPVTFDSGVCIDGYAKIAGNLVQADIVTLTLNLTKNYSKVEFLASSFRASVWEIVYIDDVGGTPSETILCEFLTGPGQFSMGMVANCKTFTTVGGTGVQNLVLRGINQNNASDFRGYLGVLEAA